MDALQRARRPVRNEVNKLVVELQELCSSERVEREDVCLVLRLLNEAYNSLSELDQKITEQMVIDNASDDVQDVEYDLIQVMKRKVMATRMKAEKILENPEPVSLSSPSVVIESNGGGRGCRLPKLELKKFSGDLKDWLGYWAQFEKIDADATLHGSDKFQYLLQSLTPGTDAYEIASSYPQSNENYPKVIEVLKRRYGNEDLLLQVYIRELLKLVISNVNSNVKIPFHMLHLKLESHLRALKTLKLEKADPATWLFPLVESSLPEDILLTWQRSPMSSCDSSKDEPPRSRLDRLMSFLEKEMDIQQKINLARGGFEEKKNKENVQKKYKPPQQTSTLSSCYSGEPSTCLFCDKNHESKDCKTAKYWPLDRKRSILKEKKLCFACFRSKHFARLCRAKLACIICGGKHHPVMCSNLENHEIEHKHSTEKPKVMSVLMTSTENMTGMANQICSKQIALQTILVTICNGDKRKVVRAFLDNGSQGSYILKSTAAELGLEVQTVEDVSHYLFGGTQTEVVRHNKYHLKLENVDGSYSCIINVRDQHKICNFIPRISNSTSNVLKELKENKIKLSDVGEGCPPIEILIGADVYGRVLTGKITTLACGVVAIETKLGWTLCGKLRGVHEDSLSMCVLSMALNDSSISQLWNLDVIGIRDETDVKTISEREEEDKKKFIDGLSRKQDGRYVISLPWVDEHPPLPTNKEIAIKRLELTTRKLCENKLFESYSTLFQDWKSEGFIEEVSAEMPLMRGKVHYLPHRAVIKLSSMTTPVRPVFDASCKVGKAPSLNDCLKKGSNYIQLIPEILLHFREKKIGFVSDIRKAFQMIEVKEEDRDCMRFLWWKNKEKQELIEYRHVRVMFGATCSPFILGAVIEFHLKANSSDKQFAERLLQTLYVDNCVCSEDTIEEYQYFRKKSIALLSEAKMDLRLWMSNIDEMEDPSTHTVSVLGVLWDRLTDELFVNVKDIPIPEIVTKRTVLSFAQRVFDPIGIVSPAIISLKIILQKIWINKMKWDEPLPKDENRLFCTWVAQLQDLNRIRIPRWFIGEESDRQHWTLHVFTDASNAGYSAVVFLRVQHPIQVSVQLIAAKARVSPVKPVTIPRLELLGCLIGARLAATVIKTLNMDDLPIIYWSDSTTALAWIRRSEQWGTYVGNRVTEIRKLTDVNQWRHVPGFMNPADLPSRGCLPTQLVEKKWWEGPQWLKDKQENWPYQQEEVLEEFVQAERKKSAKSTVMLLLDELKKNFTFRQWIRILAWCHRFINNVKKISQRRSGKLTAVELKLAEVSFIRSIQQEAFIDKNQLTTLNTYVDSNNIIRVKTKIILREDFENFRYPAVLPGKNEKVKQLILDMHRCYCHAGVGFLMVKLREKYWILKARKTIKSVLNSCIKCKRNSVRSATASPPPLPIERIQDANVFEVIGVDVAGPLFLKNNKKVWVLIFTCAVFRAVRLEVISSLSTVAFIEVLKKFIRMNGRPKIIFSDNGTNFHGTNNFFRSLNWTTIQDLSQLKPIQWKFNVATAPWWGGWWERLIRTMKDLMKRTIGKATLKKSELEDVLVIVEEVMNGRPLTYVTEDDGELEPLTPSMFISTPSGLQFPEGCESDVDKIRYRWKYLTTLRKELHQRFRNEYLALLVNRAKERSTRTLRECELVLVGSDNVKRLHWPLGRIIELIPGKDNISRVAKVKTQNGIVTRPIQRLFPLELNLEDSCNLEKFFKESIFREKSQNDSYEGE